MSVTDLSSLESSTSQPTQSTSETASMKQLRAVSPTSIPHSAGQTIESNFIISPNPHNSKIEDVMTPTESLKRGSLESEDQSGKITQNSLKRRRIPPPLGINNRANGNNGINNNNVPTSSRGSVSSVASGKPRVQYLGKVSTARPSIQSAYPYPRSSSVAYMPPQMYPYMPQPQGNYLPHSAYPPPQYPNHLFQHQHSNPYLSGMPVPYQPLQTTGAYPQPYWMNPIRSASYVSQSSIKQEKSKPNFNRHGSDACGSPASQLETSYIKEEDRGQVEKKTNDDEDEKGEGDENGNKNEEHSDSASVDTDAEEDENADLAIEDGAVPTPVFTKHPRLPQAVHGEVRILSNRFSFEFNSRNEIMDKKVFMSICNQVWDESIELNNKH